MDELFHSCSRNILLHILLQQLATAALRDEVLNQESHQPVPVPSSQSSADCIGKRTDTNSFSAFCISLAIICNFHLRCWLPKHSKYFMAQYLSSVLNPSNLNLFQTTQCVYIHICMYASIYIHIYSTMQHAVYSQRVYHSLLIFKESSTYLELFIKNMFLLEKSKQIFTVFCEQIVLGLVTKQTTGTANPWFYTWDEQGPAVSLIEKSNAAH